MTRDAFSEICSYTGGTLKMGGGERYCHFKLGLCRLKQGQFTSNESLYRQISFHEFISEVNGIAKICMSTTYGKIMETLKIGFTLFCQCTYFQISKMRKLFTKYYTQNNINSYCSKKSVPPINTYLESHER